MRIFVDTSAFIALIDEGDNYHQKAKSFILKFSEEQVFCTNNYVIHETITRLRNTAGYNTALRFAKMIFSSKLYQIHYVDRNLESIAIEEFKKLADKKVTFTDCISFALMRKLGIDKVFAFDNNFIQMGFEVVPK